MGATRGKRAAVEDVGLGDALRAMSDGVVVLDGAGIVLGANPAFAATMGGDPTGTALETLVTRPGADGTLADALRAAVDAPWCGELRGTTDGVWEATLAAMPGGRFVGVFRDVRARHRAEEARLEFLSMVTHDIKGPLTVILGYAELLSDPDEAPSPAILSDTLGRIRESGEQIHALVSNFVELSRIEAGQHVLDRRPVDLGELLSRLAQHHAPRARRKGVELTLEEAAVPEVMGDRPQLERVVVNLLGNAIKYTPRGGRITVRTRREDGFVAIVVEDTGPGIAPEDLGDIFEKYRRAPAARRVDGVGLGLFIARTIAHAHGGDVRVDSTPGRGSTFTLLLPAE